MKLGGMLCLSNAGNVRTVALLEVKSNSSGKLLKKFFNTSEIHSPHVLDVFLKAV